MLQLDSLDIKLLAALQSEGPHSAIDLSKHLGMSASQIGRRRQRLEQEGFIDRSVFRLSPKALGLDVQAFIQIQTESQTRATHQSILELVNRQPQVVAAWTLTGEDDYIFRVFCSGLPDLNALIQNVLLPHKGIGRVQSQIVMGEMKDDTALPLDHLT
ncbi:Lrp/AsnC family transcriptional regulator [Thalassobium sp. R2A62]|jgi:DNA-binding Lrp family transcriptional regulator|uniref:Lrp/AsnC family transcriptional regulator n=1 Tax=Thalassobium sp. R2A62 TaxID=633131 RepID=UPI0001B1D769|nr:Lrp/AsnC family transcriptional regulator [Thalassobium sp. R2A62]EET49336.1 transcriptional regulator, AsnC family [Thalassobium sp. R2A62]MDG1339325.1 Lrp/AsnC family transcriptional regulator [Paracoccaceae bacterium]MDG2451294.1 Lrp/AsnC family transcriptional regulator [Paracoccaceae bacterium]